jgi:D-amino-acid dehydrogenase
VNRFSNRPIVVVGAGGVGCATAYFLAEAGHRVKLLDSADQCASGASGANRAQLSYSFVEPLATPSLLPKIPGILFGRDPALKVCLKASLSQWRWGLAFLVACRDAAVQATTKSQLRLAEMSRLEIERLLEAGLNFGYAKAGKLVLLDSRAEVGRAFDTLSRQRNYGASQILLTRSETLAREPALALSSAEIFGAIWSEGDALCDPALLCAALINASRAYDFELLLNFEAIGFKTRSQRIDRLMTTSGEFEVADVVVANGTAAPKLLKTLGIHARIQPIKGYSITLPSASVTHMPRTSITDLKRKIVYAPLGNRLRVAGCAELSAADTVSHPAKARDLLHAARARFGCTLGEGELSSWAGLRPSTPGSRPIIARTRFSNLWLNVGHGALGLTLAMGFARRIERLISRSHASANA